MNAPLQARIKGTHAVDSRTSVGYISQLISSTKIAFLLNIEAARAEVMDMDTIINRFAEMKARRKQIV